MVAMICHLRVGPEHKFMLVTVRLCHSKLWPSVQS